MSDFSELEEHFNMQVGEGCGLITIDCDCQDCDAGNYLAFDKSDVIAMARYFELTEEDFAKIENS